MPYTDLIILAILLLFFAHGFKRGLIQVLGGLVGIVIGAYLASMLGQQFQGTTRFVAFFIVFVLINRVAALAFYLVDKIFHFVAIIPGLSTINRIAGGLVGLVEGIVVLGILLFVAQRLNFIPLVDEIYQQTQLMPPLVTVGELFLPLLKGLFEV
jgi:uncharacterized membrane protein required for colicin V production